MRQAAARYGAKTELAHALGYSRQRIHQKLLEEDGFTNEELHTAARVLVVAEANRALEDARQADYQAETFDEKLLAEIIEGLEGVLEELKRKMPPAKKAALIARIYRRDVVARAIGEPSTSGAEIIRLVRDAG